MDSLADCPAGQYGFTGTGGWYFFVSFGEFRLLHSYLQGNHQAECNDTSTLASTAGVGTGNLPNNCLIGYFKSPRGRGRVRGWRWDDSADHADTEFSVQFIR